MNIKSPTNKSILSINSNPKSMLKSNYAYSKDIPQSVKVRIGKNEIYQKLEEFAQT